MRSVLRTDVSSLLVVSLCLLAACGSSDSGSDVVSAGGNAGAGGGSAGAGFSGKGGSAGLAGSSGKGGSAGTAGASAKGGGAGMAGSSGKGGSAGASGTAGASGKGGGGSGGSGGSNAGSGGASGKGGSGGSAAGSGGSTAGSGGSTAGAGGTSAGSGGAAGAGAGSGGASAGAAGAGGDAGAGGVGGWSTTSAPVVFANFVTGWGAVKPCAGPPGLNQPHPLDLFAADSAAPPSITDGQVSVHVSVPIDSSLAFVDAAGDCSGTPLLEVPGIGNIGSSAATVIALGDSTMPGLAGPYLDHTAPVIGKSYVRFFNDSGYYGWADLGGLAGNAFTYYFYTALSGSPATGAGTGLTMDAQNYILFEPTTQTLAFDPGTGKGPEYKFFQPVEFLSSGVQTMYLVGNTQIDGLLYICDELSATAGLQTCQLSVVVPYPLVSRR